MILYQRQASSFRLIYPYTLSRPPRPLQFTLREDAAALLGLGGTYSMYCTVYIITPRLMHFPCKLPSTVCIVVLCTITQIGLFAIPRIHASSHGSDRSAASLKYTSQQYCTFMSSTKLDGADADATGVHHYWPIPVHRRLV